MRLATDAQSMRLGDQGTNTCCKAKSRQATPTEVCGALANSLTGASADRSNIDSETGYTVMMRPVSPALGCNSRSVLLRTTRTGMSQTLASIRSRVRAFESNTTSMEARLS